MPPSRIIENEDVHFQSGRGRGYDGQRFLNQSHLSAIAPDFIAQLIVPDEELIELGGEEFDRKGLVFPVEKIDGPQWQTLVHNPRFEYKGRVLEFGFKDHIEVALKTLEQMQFLFETYKILLTDRNETNVVLRLYEDEQNPKAWKYKVYQVDFASVYDAVNGTSVIANEVDLLSRAESNQPVAYKDPEVTQDNLSHQLRFVVGHIIEQAKKESVSESIRPEVHDVLTGFEKTWNVKGVSQVNGEFLDFKTARGILVQVLEIFDMSSSHNSEFSLEAVKRPYTVADIRVMQNQFRTFEQYRKAHNAPYIIGNNQFYEFLNTGSLSGRASIDAGQELIPENEAKYQDYENLILRFYRGWRENLIKRKSELAQSHPRISRELGDLEKLPEPLTLSELRDLYHKNPTLNNFSGVSYQEGIGEKGMLNVPFLHFHGHRRSGYELSKQQTEVRIYLNPPQEALPLLAQAFIEQAQSQQLPYYFKLIDFSLQKSSVEDLKRKDRMVFFVDKATLSKVLMILNELSRIHPQWFVGRSLPTLASEVSPGIGVTEDPSDFQKRAFSRLGDKNVSFNWVRAQFLKEVWRDVTKDVLIHNRDVRPRSGRTLREIFNDMVPVEDKGYISKIWEAGLEKDALDDKSKRVLEDALLRTMADVISNLEANSLLPYLNKQIQEKSRKYKIHPNNLALNE